MKRLTRTYSATTREHARTLRQQGFTYTEIIAELGGDIPKNTIQSWVRDIQLTPAQKARIKQKEVEAQQIGHQLGAEWNREQKRQRIAAAEAWAQPIAERFSQNPDVILMMLGALWAGEGEKKDDVLSLANSDPAIIKAWTFGLRTLFDLDESKFRVQILISSGMPEEELKLYWSGVTAIPISQFQKSSVDIRPKTVIREGYKGVCRVIYFSADLRRRLGALTYAVFNKFNSIQSSSY